MLEYLILLPNITAGISTMLNNAFLANLIYCFGYIPFIVRNFRSGDRTQMIYFLIMEVMAVIGVLLVVLKNNN